MKKNIGIVLLTLSNILSTLTVFAIAGLLAQLNTLALENAASSTNWDTPINLVTILFEVVKWFGFYQVIFKKSLTWIKIYIVLALVLVLTSAALLFPLLATVFYILALFLLFLVLLLIILYATSIVLLFSSIMKPAEIHI